MVGKKKIIVICGIVVILMVVAGLAYKFIGNKDVAAQYSTSETAGISSILGNKTKVERITILGTYKNIGETNETDTFVNKSVKEISNEKEIKQFLKDMDKYEFKKGKIADNIDSLEGIKRNDNLEEITVALTVENSKYDRIDVSMGSKRNKYAFDLLISTTGKNQSEVENRYEYNFKDRALYDYFDSKYFK